jgi:hypothetical protein
MAMGIVMKVKGFTGKVSLILKNIPKNVSEKNK